MTPNDLQEKLAEGIPYHYECSKPPVPLKTIRAQISYAPETGAFTRFAMPRGPAKLGPITVKPNETTFGPYYYISVCCKGLSAHRLAWLLMTGKWPSKEYQIDHINRNSLDNRWKNLRLVTVSWNQQNSDSSYGSSPYRGVSWYKPGHKWRAQIQVSGKKHYLGDFDDPKQARDAYLEARKKMQPGYPHG